MITDGGYSLFFIQFDASKRTAKLSSMRLTRFEELWPGRVSQTWEKLTGLMMVLALDSLSVNI